MNSPDLEKFQRLQGWRMLLAGAFVGLQLTLLLAFVVWAFLRR